MDEDDGRPLVGRQATERTIELVPVGDHARCVRHCADVDRAELDLESTTTEAPALVQAGSDEEAVEPGVETIGIAEGGKVPPGPNEGLLDSILGPFRIAQDQSRCAIEPAGTSSDEVGEGLGVAPCGSVDQVPLHHALGAGTVIVTGLTEYGERPSRFRLNFGRARVAGLPAGLISLTPAATYRQLSPARGANAREQLDTSDRGWISEWFARCRLEILVALRDGADPAGVPGAPAHAIALYWERIARGQVTFPNAKRHWRARAAGS